MRFLAGGIALFAMGALAEVAPLTQDSYVVPATASNYGSAPTSNVGGPSGNQALMQFDLSTLPLGLTGANIAKAMPVSCAIAAGGLSAAGNSFSATAPTTNVISVLKAAAGVATPTAAAVTCTINTANSVNAVGSCTSGGTATFAAGDIMPLQDVQTSGASGFVKISTIVRCQ